ncbi:hypothetical protein E4U45_007472, partial [Claviceps purpurea]
MQHAISEPSLFAFICIIRNSTCRRGSWARGVRRNGDQGESSDPFRPSQPPGSWNPPAWIKKGNCKSSAAVSETEALMSSGRARLA